jgi:hypothetical protein
MSRKTKILGIVLTICILLLSGVAYAFSTTQTNFYDATVMLYNPSFGYDIAYFNAQSICGFNGNYLTAQQTKVQFSSISDPSITGSEIIERMDIVWHRLTVNYTGYDNNVDMYESTSSGPSCAHAVSTNIYVSNGSSGNSVGGDFCVTGKPGWVFMANGSFLRNNITFNN